MRIIAPELARLLRDLPPLQHGAGRARRTETVPSHPSLQPKAKGRRTARPSTAGSSLVQCLCSACPDQRRTSSCCLQPLRRGSVTLLRRDLDRVGRSRTRRSAAGVWPWTRPTRAIAVPSRDCERGWRPTPRSLRLARVSNGHDIEPLEIERANSNVSEFVVMGGDTPGSHESVRRGHIDPQPRARSELK